MNVDRIFGVILIERMKAVPELRLADYAIGCAQKALDNDALSTRESGAILTDGNFVGRPVK